MIDFIKRCLNALQPTNGLLILKENCSRFDDYIVDTEDSSVARHENVFLKLFEMAGAEVVLAENQVGFPDALFPVKMFALKKKECC